MFKPNEKKKKKKKEILKVFLLVKHSVGMKTIICAASLPSVCFKFLVWFNVKYEDIFTVGIFAAVIEESKYMHQTHVFSNVISTHLTQMLFSNMGHIYFTLP